MINFIRPFSGVGIIMLIITAFIALPQYNFLTHSATVQGTVIENVRHLSVENGGHVYAPVVTFTSADGQTEKFESETQTSPASFKIGDKVNVIYDPANPAHAQINSPVELWLATWIVGGIGLVFLIVGFLFKF